MVRSLSSMSDAGSDWSWNSDEDEAASSAPTAAAADATAAASAAAAAAAATTAASEAAVLDSLRSYHHDLADGQVTARLEAALSAERFEDFVGYYRTRPELARYTVAKDLDRLSYAVDGVRDRAVVRDRVESAVEDGDRELAVCGSATTVDTPGGRRHLAVRLANQSLFASMLEGVTAQYVGWAAAAASTAAPAAAAHRTSPLSGTCGRICSSGSTSAGSPSTLR